MSARGLSKKELEELRKKEEEEAAAHVCISYEYKLIKHLKFVVNVRIG